MLAGEVPATEILLKPASWWRDRGVTLCYGAAVTAVDTASGTVTLADGKALAFAKLVFATGSRPIRLPVAGADLRGVLTFRDVADVGLISRAARRGTRVVVIGGGLLGIEAAYGLAKAGAKVTLVHLMDRLMERQLDARAAAMLKRAVEATGIEVLLGAATAGSSAMGGSRRWNSKTAAPLRRKWLSSRSALSRMRRLRPRPVSRSIAGSSSMITFSPMRPASLRSANAPSIAASATDWSSPLTNRRACSPSGSPAAMSATAAA